MNDKKFDALRKKLDALHFTQTLHPDSFQLVDKLYNQLFKCMSDLQKERKKSLNSASTSDNSILNDRIDSLTNQRDVLRRQLEEARSGVPQRQSDERIRNLTTIVNNFRVKQEESTLQYQREVKKLSSEVASLQMRNGQLQKENQSLRGSNAQTYNQFQRQAADLANLVQRKGKEIRQLQDSNSKLRIRVQVLEKSIEQNKFTGREIQKQSKSQSDRFQSILKQELADSQAKCRQLKTELDIVRQDGENLKRQTRRLRQQLTNIRQAESSSRSLQNIDRTGRQKVGHMYEQVRQQLEQRMQEIKKLRDCLEENQNQNSRLEAKVKDLSNKNKFLSDKNTDLQTQIQLISTKSTLNVKRVRQLEATTLSLQKQLKENISQGGGGSEQIIKELREQQMKCQQLRRDTVIKEREVKLLEEQLRVLKEQSEQRAIERDRSQLQLKKLQTIMADGSRNLHALQLQKQELMKENRQLRTGKQILSSADSAAKSELFLLKEKLQGAQARIDELESILNGERIHTKQLQAEIARMNSAMMKSEQKNKQIFEDNRLMAGQIKVLEDRKNQLHQKVKDLQERAHVQLEGSSINRRELDQLITKNEELVSQLGRKDQALRRIDAEKDELQNQLDRETEEKAQLKDQLIALERDLRQYSRGIQEGQQGMGELQRKLSRSESVREQLQRQYQRLVEQDAVLRDRLSATEASLRELNNEVALLVASKNEEQRQAARSRNKIAQLDRRLRDCKNQAEQERERASAMNILSSELQGEVERERAEVVRLRGFVGQLEEANNHMYQLLEGKDHDIDELGRALEESERRQEQYIHEINSYQRQLENLSQDLDMAQEDARRAHGEREVLRAERNWKKDVSSLTQDWRTKQEERFVEVQQDYQRCKNECDQLRHRCRQLQEMLSEERVRSHRLAQQSHIGTPTSQVALVESRVQSYVENQNFNNSNVYARGRNHSLQHIPDNLNQSEESQSQSVKSAKLSLMEIERKYMQNFMPNLKPSLKL